MKPLFLLPLVIAAALAFGAYFGLQNKTDTMPSTREGGPAPALTFTKLGTLPDFAPQDLASGDVVLVNFWASWCAPCRVEHPQLVTLAESGVRLYGVNYKDNPQNALKFLDEHGNPFAALGADVSGRTGLDWGITGVPETFIIDRNGIVVKRFSGPISESVLEKTIRPAIEEARARSN